MLVYISSYQEGHAQRLRFSSQLLSLKMLGLRVSMKNVRVEGVSKNHMFFSTFV